MVIKTKQAESRQQKEARTFFDTKASDWDDKVSGQAGLRVNVQAQRNDYVLHVIDSREETRYALDIGCGVGDLVIKMAERGINATGIDFARGMIDIAHRRLTESRAEVAEFVAGDYFDWHVPDDTYDVISANGFIEYISFEQRDQFFRDGLRSLRPGGSLVVSSRNRLFNLWSLNDFTKRELADNTIESLLLEAMALAQGSSISDLLALNAAPLSDPGIKHSDTGVAVSTRYQYTPIQLMQLIGQAGLEIVEVSPIHVHGVPPAFKEAHPEMHVLIANGLQEHAVENHVLLPHASAFMVHAKKSQNL